MPANKKKNAFYFFMKEMKDKEAAKGYNISIHDMPTLAHPIWANLSIPEREKYEELARRFKNDPRYHGAKLASDGTRIEDNVRKAEEEEFLKREMIQAIKRFCNTDCPATDKFKELMARKFIYFISFNILCHTEDNVYIPIEVGLVEYSIQCGINREYHKILNPGGIPTGYTGAAKRISEEKHQIDVFGEKDAERNMKKLYEEILNFTNSHKSEELPPMFCLESHIELTVGCLNWLAERARRENVFNVLDAAHLLLELRAATNEPLPSRIIAEDLLTKTSFDYNSEVRCDYHEEKDVRHCALAYSKCLAYLFSDAVVLQFGAELTNNHLPSIATEEKNYKVSFGPDMSRYNRPSAYVIRSDEKLDRRECYLETEDEPNESWNSVAPQAKVQEDRQPVSRCLSENMSRLHLNITPATVPGHGIGRGLRRKT